MHSARASDISSQPRIGRMPPVMSIDYIRVGDSRDTGVERLRQIAPVILDSRWLKVKAFIARWRRAVAKIIEGAD